MSRVETGQQPTIRPASVTRRRRALQTFLLVCVASGLLINNVVFFNLGDLPVTLVWVLAVILWALGLRSWLARRSLAKFPGVALPALCLIVYEFLIHGLLAHSINNVEWTKSFSLLLFCVGLFIALSKFRLHEHELPGLAQAVGYLCYVMGGLGLFQAIISTERGWTWYLLPAWLRSSTTPWKAETLRFHGFIRALGFSREPSSYGLGMVILVGLCLALLAALRRNEKCHRFLTGALLVALGGVGASLSLAAWGVLLPVLLASVFASTRVTRRQLQVGLVIMVGLVLVGLALFPYIQPRLQGIVAGYDTSANVRLAPIQLILKPGHDIPSTLFGVGVGQEADSPRLWQVMSHVKRQVDPDREVIIVTNGVAYVAVTMGWVGLALHGWLIAGVFGRRGRFRISMLPLLVLVGGYFFALAWYLSPEWWVLLAIISAHKGLRIRGGSEGVAGNG